MAKTKFRMKLSGLEIEYEGEREDVPRITSAIGDQFGQMISTPAVVSAQKRRLDSSNSDSVTNDRQNTGSNSSKPKGRSTKKAPKEAAAAWDHDNDKWGCPLQSWKVQTKAIWLLFVANEAADIKQMSSAWITTTFNEHFRNSGQITTSNVTRDLNKVSTGASALVQLHTTSDRKEWFLTVNGRDFVKSLIAEATVNA